MATFDDYAPVISQVIGNLPQAAMMLDADSQIQFANQSAIYLFGYAREEMEGMQLDVLIPESHRQRHEALLRDYVGSRAACVGGHHERFLARRKDGREFSAKASLSRLQVPDAPAMALVILAEISERTIDASASKYIEQASAGSESLVALDMIVDSVAVLDR